MLNIECIFNILMIILLNKEVLFGFFKKWWMRFVKIMNYLFYLGWIV